jgi:hypothetical protein
MRLLDTLAAQVVAWALAISMVVLAILGGAAIIQANSRSDQDMCIASGGSFSYDSTSPLPSAYKETCTK